MKACPFLISLLICLLSAGLADELRAESADDQLNAEYNAIVNAPNANPRQVAELRQVQRAWLGFRDYWANQEATAGRKSPDEAVRQAAIERITRQRVEQLQHIAKDNTAVDFSTQRAEPRAMEYNSQLCAVFDNKKLGPSPDTYLWSQFADSQEHFDARWYAPAQTAGNTNDYYERIGRLDPAYDRLLLGHLKALATAAGLNADDLTAGEEPTKENTDATIPSANGGFRLVAFHTSANETKAWVVPTNGKPHTELALINSDGHGREFYVSPDGQWIVCTGDVCVGEHSIWLFHLAAPADFRFDEVPDFEAKIWKYFVKITGVKADGGILDFTAWRPGVMRFELLTTRRHDGAERDVFGWQAEYDLEKATFSVPKDLEDANRKALAPQG